MAHVIIFTRLIPLLEKLESSVKGGALNKNQNTFEIDNWPDSKLSSVLPAIFLRDHIVLEKIDHEGLNMRKSKFLIFLQDHIFSYNH